MNRITLYLSGGIITILLITIGVLKFNNSILKKNLEITQERLNVASYNVTRLTLSLDKQNDEIKKLQLDYNNYTKKAQMDLNKINKKYEMVLDKNKQNITTQTCESELTTMKDLLKAFNETK